MNSPETPTRNSRHAHTGPTPSRPERPLEVAVIGAGMSGLVCARLLAESGHQVRIFDKARGPGGRMATRRAGPLRFDWPRPDPVKDGGVRRRNVDAVQDGMRRQSEPPKS